MTFNFKLKISTPYAQVLYYPITITSTNCKTTAYQAKIDGGATADAWIHKTTEDTTTFNAADMFENINSAVCELDASDKALI